MHLSRVTAAALLLAVVLGATPLLAHLALVKTLPVKDATLRESPARVQVWFNQEPAARVSRLDLTGPSGEVSLGDLQIDTKERSLTAPIPGTLAPGRYEVTWRTAGTDGHVQRGTFAFSVASAE